MSRIKGCLLVARNMSGIIAHNLSGLRVIFSEVTNETDRVDAKDQEDAI